ncbi:protein of unknown function [Methylocaldum szegediense]|uniref:Uncharacterized protein n=1 Tax=Methylocaldum szegediense TaxID=73780 RepID=A0ABM9I2R9_9GAMM|nr:protein of unknown function [Methylocaldum szegediense]
MVAIAAIVPEISALKPPLLYVRMVLLPPVLRLSRDCFLSLAAGSSEFRTNRPLPFMKN